MNKRQHKKACKKLMAQKPLRSGLSIIERLMEESKILEATTPPPRRWFSLGDQ